MSLPLALDGVLDRLVLLERKALPDAKNAVRYEVYVQHNVPYWTNRVGNWQKASGSGSTALWIVTIHPRLVMGHLTEGYEGTNQSQGPLLIAQAVEYFDVHNHLIDLDDEATSDPVRWLAPEPIRIGGGRTGYSAIAKTTQHVAELDLTVTLAVSYGGI
ncbi:MAG TPA: hypothetical protein PKD09_10600 [Aggregatilinea sp.]|uniref:hypothetical protein n=1 Tax=Aggregatilinea sp. TaxID=2806333 RepID=UPI002C91D45B|nr:hypothetical protein [Aggregatilinea sp.]HML22092.1 hypothetical protein [Aggregatilinea sp.]